jgi:hypothetical protein
MWKRLSMVGLAAVSIGFLPTTAANAGNNKTVTKTVDQVAWTILGTNCDEIPDDNSLSGMGTMRTTTSTKTLDNGTVRMVSETIGSGTATDRDGNVYDWAYVGASKTRTSKAEPAVFRGIFDDFFEVSGSGPVTYVSTFKAHYAEEFGVFFEFIPIKSSGDPFAFPSGGGRCDPV